MKQFHREDYQITSFVRQFIREQVTKGDICIDATAGNGNDTLLLCELSGPEGKVLAFDIQKEALEHTEKRLEEAGQKAELIPASHAEMEEYAKKAGIIPGTVSCIVFNFGYLPGGDHKIATKASSSIAAVSAGLKLLAKGGLMTLCIYSGGDTGYEERDALLSFVKGLDSREYQVIRSDYYNRPNDPPVPVLIRKLV